MQTCGMGMVTRTGILVLTRRRHDREPSQVFPLDATNRLALIRLHGLGAEYSGNGRIHD